MSGNSRQVLYALECGHAAPGPATLVSGSLICAWCQDRQIIAGVIEYEWTAVCRNCTFVRYAGLSKHNAGVFATGHTRHSPAHAVVLEYRRNPTAMDTARKFREWQVRKSA